MTQDFTKVGIQPEPPPGDAVTETVRHGLPPVSGKAGLARAWGKMTGEVPFGADAPTKALRKTIGGGWALLHLLKYGLLAVVALVFGALFCWAGVHGEFSLSTFGVGIALLAGGIVMARWALAAARELRSISKA